MKKIELADKEIFENYLNKRSHFLSYFSFVNIFIWKDLFEISYLKIRDSLCVFFKDKIGIFMIIPPLGNIEREIIFECFEIMDSENLNKSISRIENTEERDLDFYKDLGFKFKLRDREYICKRSDIVNLKGERFKSKRNSYNYFLRNYKFEYLTFDLSLRDDCFNLYKLWKEERKEKFSDSVYRKMLEDNFSCFKVALENYENLNLSGRLVKIDGKLCGLSFGFPLNKETFCILFEITDLRYRGISQFIFREFCRELSGYEYINIMDDSGLENLRKAKLSYRPVLEIPEYIITG